MMVAVDTAIAEAARHLGADGTALVMARALAAAMSALSADPACPAREEIGIIAQAMVKAADARVGDSEWWTARELGALGVRGWGRVAVQKLAARWREEAAEGTAWRRRHKRGGGHEYHVSILPPELRRVIGLPSGASSILHRSRGVEVDLRRMRALTKREEPWGRFEAARHSKRQAALKRLHALDEVRALASGGEGRVAAMQSVARKRGVTLSTLYNWQSLVKGVSRSDWLPHLTSNGPGRTAKAPCSPEAWDFLVRRWQQPGRPSMEECVKQTRDEAAARGWAVPSNKTLRRRLEALPPQGLPPVIGPGCAPGSTGPG